MDVQFDFFAEFCVKMLKDPQKWICVSFKWEENPGNTPEQVNFPRVVLSIGQLKLFATRPRSDLERLMLVKYEEDYDFFVWYCKELLTDPHCWRYVNFNWDEDVKIPPHQKRFPWGRATVSVRNGRVFATKPSDPGEEYQLVYFQSKLTDPDLD